MLINARQPRILLSTLGTFGSFDLLIEQIQKSQSTNEVLQRPDNQAIKGPKKANIYIFAKNATVVRLINEEVQGIAIACDLFNETQDGKDNNECNC